MTSSSKCASIYTVGKVEKPKLLRGLYWNGKYGNPKLEMQITWKVTCSAVDCESPKVCKGPATDGPHTYEVALSKVEVDGKNLEGTSTNDDRRAISACGERREDGTMPTYASYSKCVTNHLAQRQGWSSDDVLGQIIKYFGGTSEDNKGTLAKLVPKDNKCYCLGAGEYLDNCLDRCQWESSMRAKDINEANIKRDLGN
tara:strand:+ start:333 stop:929 length:597 start_codon:yes stop_codon:yes gene_type:complete